MSETNERRMDMLWLIVYELLPGDRRYFGGEFFSGFSLRWNRVVCGCYCKSACLEIGALIGEEFLAGSISRGGLFTRYYCVKI